MSTNLIYFDYDIDYYGIALHVKGWARPGQKEHLSDDPYYSSEGFDANVEDIIVTCNKHEITSALSEEAKDEISEIVIDLMEL